ncbi:MAG TPA: hypothetical protein VJA18_06585 [Candidatus Nanoarchaeia archaeon]|nr:hypothetical protein [Candidatus Nanoarchaeia archaeon]
MRYLPFAAAMSVISCGSQQAQEEFRTPVIVLENQLELAEQDLVMCEKYKQYSIGEQLLSDLIKELYFRMEKKRIAFIDVEGVGDNEGFILQRWAKEYGYDKDGLYFSLYCVPEKLFVSVYDEEPLGSPDRAGYIAHLGNENEKDVYADLPLQGPVLGLLKVMVVASWCHFNEMSYATREENGVQVEVKHALRLENLPAIPEYSAAGEQIENDVLVDILKQ